MNLSISNLMIIFFIISLVVSIWKIYAFLPNKELSDDDTTKESVEELQAIVLKVLKNSNGIVSYKELCLKVKEDESFDSEHFWRFNQNKLKQILNRYYLENKDISSLEDLYKFLNR